MTIPKLVSDRDLYQIEKDLSLLHIIEDIFVKNKNQKITVNDFIGSLIIHKTPYLKVAQLIFNDAKQSGYIIVEHSTVKPSTLLHETIICYEKAIEAYYKKNNVSVSIFEIDRKFDEIIVLLKKILNEKGEPKI
jgi:hypothetical protein